MIKRLILRLINSVFGLNLSMDQFNAFIEFIKVLIGIFGSAELAASYCSRTAKAAKSVHVNTARSAFDGIEKTLGG